MGGEGRGGEEKWGGEKTGGKRRPEIKGTGKNEAHKT